MLVPSRLPLRKELVCCLDQSLAWIKHSSRRGVPRSGGEGVTPDESVSCVNVEKKNRLKASAFSSPETKALLLYVTLAGIEFDLVLLR